MESIFAQIDQELAKLGNFQPLSPEHAAKLDERYRIELSYASNHLEGSAFKKDDVELLVEKGLAIGGKSIVEHFKVLNYVLAWEYIKQLSTTIRRQQIGEKELFHVHQLLSDRVDHSPDNDYRTSAISGYPSPIEITALISGMFESLGQSKDHPVQIAADFHQKLIDIQPFESENGHAARLMMNLVLMQEGYPPAIIAGKLRETYLRWLTGGSASQSKDAYYEMIYQAIKCSIDTFLDVVQPKSEEVQAIKPTKRLLKIGELARSVGETVPTIRYWTNEGLLSVKGHSKGGYQLYDRSMIDQAKNIRKLQNEDRLSISELKKRFT